MSEDDAEEGMIHRLATFAMLQRKLLHLSNEASSQMPNNAYDNPDWLLDRYLMAIKQAIVDRLADGRIKENAMGLTIEEICEILEEAKWWENLAEFPGRRNQAGARIKLD